MLFIEITPDLEADDSRLAISFSNGNPVTWINAFIPFQIDGISSMTHDLIGLTSDCKQEDQL